MGFDIVYVLYYVSTTRVSLTPKHIELASKDESKLLKLIYYTSDVFTYKNNNFLIHLAYNQAVKE